MNLEKKKITQYLWNEYTTENKSMTIKRWLKVNKLPEWEKIKAAARPYGTPMNCWIATTTSSDDVLPNQRLRYSSDDMLDSLSRHLCISNTFQH